MNRKYFDLSTAESPRKYTLKMSRRAQNPVMSVDLVPGQCIRITISWNGQRRGKDRNKAICAAVFNAMDSCVCASVYCSVSTIETNFVCFLLRQSNIRNKNDQMLIKVCRVSYDVVICMFVHIYVYHAFH